MSSVFFKASIDYIEISSIQENFEMMCNKMMQYAAGCLELSSQSNWNCVIVDTVCIVGQNNSFTKILYKKQWWEIVYCQVQIYLEESLDFFSTTSTKCNNQAMKCRHSALIWEVLQKYGDWGRFKAEHKIYAIAMHAAYTDRAYFHIAPFSGTAHALVYGKSKCS